MNIGNTIKELRLKKRITQEELAENLGVSPKAVSRWENQTTFPDISLLPAIAYYFGITTDELLGVDLYKKDEDIKLILEEVKKYKHSGDMLKLIELLKNGLKKYPNNFVLLEQLSFALLMIYRSSHKYKDELLECIKINEKILAECQDEQIKHTAIKYLVSAYRANEELEKAKALVETLPSISISKERMLSSILKGKEGTLLHQHNISKAFGNIQSDIHYELSDNYSRNIILLKKLINLYYVFYDEEDFAFEHYELMNINILIAKNYAKLENNENTKIYLIKAINHAKCYENINGTYKHTSILFDRLVFNKDDIQTNSTKTIFEQIKDWLEGKSFNDFKQTTEYQEVIEILEELNKN